MSDILNYRVRLAPYWPNKWEIMAVRISGLQSIAGPFDSREDAEKEKKYLEG